MLFSCLLIFFEINFFKNSFWNSIRVSNSLNPDQARPVGPDLGPNCFQRLSTDDTRSKELSAEFLKCNSPVANLG